jgi:hypothetical protein
MRNKRRSKSSALINLVSIFLFLAGWVGGNQVQAADAVRIVQPPVASDGKLEIVQGNLIHLSTTTGEKVLFTLGVKNPVESTNYSWSVLYPPAFGVTSLSELEEAVTGTYSPNTGYSGRDHFVIEVRDQSGNSGRIGVAIEISSIASRHEPFLIGTGAFSLFKESARQDVLHNSFIGFNNPGSSQKIPSIDRSTKSSDEMGDFTDFEKVELSEGSAIERFVVNSSNTPPTSSIENEVDPNAPAISVNTVLLTEVPRFTWVFGSAAVSAAMIAGYYDRTGFPDIYTGPTNGGVVPLTDTLWGSWMDGAGVTYPNNPLVASRKGVDGRTTRGTINDYWVEHFSDLPDPYLTNSWTEHTWGDAIGDYMYTSQSAWGNLDGNTTFYGRSESPLPFTCNEIEAGYMEEDGTLGMRHFYEARGYDVGACYFQFTDTTYAGGFSLEQYKAEIDAGFPVMIHLSGTSNHSIVGVGYEAGTNTIYIHDAWLNSVNSMDWGGSYLNFTMRAVSIVHPGLAAVPENDAITTPIRITTLPFTNTQDTSLATRAADDPALLGCGEAAGKASVWYRYSPIADGMLDLDTFGSDYDTMIGVWSGAPGSLTEEACNDDFDGRQSKVFLPVKGGIDYYIGISEFKELLSPTTISSDNANKEAETADLTINKGGMMVLHASDMVTTVPLMEVNPLTDEVWGYRLMPLSEVTLAIGAFSTIRTADANGEVYFDLNGVVDIIPGTVITINDGYGNGTHTVAILAFTRVSDYDNMVWGTAGYNVNPIYVYACNDLFCARDTTGTPLGDNRWLADFNDIPYDLMSGDQLIATVPDIAGNQTFVTWRISDPYMFVDPQEDIVYVYDWFVEESDDLLYSHVLELRIDGTLVESQRTDPALNAVFPKIPVDIVTGQLLEVREDYKIIQHTVKKLKIKLIDPITDTIQGKASPGSIVVVAASDAVNENVDYVSVTTNASGVWLADFSGRVDLAPGSVVQAYVFDQDGSATWVSGHFPVPALSVDPGLDKLNGWDWTPRGTVTVAIGSFNGSFFVDQYGRFSADLAGQFDIQPGQAVVVSDGFTTKTHVTRHLSINAIDDIDEMITGNADPDSLVTVVAFDEVSSGTALSVGADTLGNWQADFYGLEDLTRETWGWVEQEDEDGDRTEIGFSIPTWPILNAINPTFAVVGQPTMTLYVEGENYTPTSVVRIGDVIKPTIFISSQLLSIELTDDELATPYDVNISVFTPPPGGGGSGIERFSVIDISPAYGEKLTTDYVIFDWGYIPAPGYKIQLSTTPDFSTLLLNAKTTEPYFADYVTPLTRGQTYYWRIRPLDYSTILPWSEPIHFYARDPLTTPVLGATVVNGYSVTLNWSPVDGAVKYKLQVAKDDTFANLIFNAPVLSPDTSKLLNLPEKTKTYYWRVRAIDGVNSKSAWSEPGQFTVPVY